MINYRIEVICNSSYALHIVNNSNGVGPLGSNQDTWIPGGCLEKWHILKKITFQFLDTVKPSDCNSAVTVLVKYHFDVLLACFQISTCHLGMPLTSEQLVYILQQVNGCWLGM